ncbi:MAG: UDP-N-acetylglucosamine 2-epimerase (hydrolyzing) [Planctomycetes bacterium]|nr:UDP-N-acetylglucosamine 2-epimerase (hydrolyzing) [Planctomycetota bacterium]
MSDRTASRTKKIRRRVAVITGSRAEYGLLKTVMESISRHPALRLQTIVTGMHLLPKFGMTIRDIEANGWKIDARVRMQRGDDDPLDQAKGLSRGIAGIAEALHQLRTQIVVVLGDRIEAMAGALAAITTGRFLAHIHGGDVATGDIDDSLRHSITKLAHLHLPATESASRRILQMGESADRIHVVGAPGLDRLRELRDEHFVDLAKLARSDDRRMALIVQHPCGRSATIERRVAENILNEVEAAGLMATCIYPNTDRGHRGIIAAITTHTQRANPDRFRVAKSLDRDEFLRSMLSAELLIGNSSCGIIEASAAGTPVVNVGSRQKGRERGGDAILNCDEDAASIHRAIRGALALGPIMPACDVYGDGHAGERIAEHLATMPLTDAFRRKTFADQTIRTMENSSIKPRVRAPRSIRDLMPV